MIDTVLFDMGGTIEDLYYGPDTLAAAAQGILDILEKHNIVAGVDVNTMAERADAGWAAYKAVSIPSGREYKPEDIWSTYIFDGLPIDLSLLNDTIYEELAHMWEVTFYTRGLRKGAREMLQGLQSLGIRMGVISNTCSLFQVFAILDQYEIREFFEDVTLSSIVGYRKPHGHIFKIALSQMNCVAARTAYVGDTLTRDVAGPQQAGFGMTFHINSFLTASRDVGCTNIVPDHSISNIYEVYEILKQQAQA